MLNDFASSEVKEVKEVITPYGRSGSEGVKTYVMQLKNYAKKAIVLTPQRP